MSVLVYCEVSGGSLKKASLEALSEGKKLAGTLGGAMNAVVIGNGLDAHFEAIKNHGAEKIFAVDAADHDNYIPEAHLIAVTEAAGQAGATVCLIPATTRGRELAPRVAAKLDAGLIEDVTGLDADGGQIVATRPEHAGKVYRTVKSKALPMVVSTRPNNFDAVANAGAGERVDLSIDFTAKAKVVETRKAGGEKIDVAEADRIVAGGRGLREEENFKLVEDLAATLNAAVGASRAVVDTDWRPHSEQIGQTGKVVSPTLYIAVGISGAIQHLAGMTTSKTIVAINKDADAPIFKVADYGIVGDAMEVLPALIAELKK
ncbi:electron transfer flavoprotein subunit alpha [bacterium BMS3Bbin04]|nr:electron transfer flavoprotein subunit alpha [bacterium BMS3Bbin04]